MNNIKKIVLHYAHRSWGVPTQLHTEYVIFTPDLVKYVRRPVKSCKTNCRVEISYCPLPCEYDLEPEFTDSTYEKDFTDLCECAESLIDKTHRDMMCDATPASLDIVYFDNRKVNISLEVLDNHSKIEFIYDIANKYAPDFFKKK